MRERVKRIVAQILTFVMLVSMMPVDALANSFASPFVSAYSGDLLSVSNELIEYTLTVGDTEYVTVSDATTDEVEVIETGDIVDVTVEDIEGVKQLVIKAVGVGSARINYHWQEYLITVKPAAPSSLTITGETEVFANRELQLSVGVTPADADSSVSWSIDQGGEYAVIDQNGLLIGVVPGQATVKVVSAADENVYDTHTVQVKEFPFEIQGNALVNELEETQLAVSFKSGHASEPVTWSSGDSSIAKVDQNGLVSALAPGRVLISAALASNHAVSTTYEVIVAAVPTQVVITGDQYVMRGETLQLTAATNKDTTANKVKVRWQSADPNIATVDEITGIVTGVSVGRVVIRAIALDGSEAYMDHSVDVISDEPVAKTFPLYHTNKQIGEWQVIIPGDGTPIDVHTLAPTTFMATDADGVNGAYEYLYSCRVGSDIPNKYNQNTQVTHLAYRNNEFQYSSDGTNFNSIGTNNTLYFQYQRVENGSQFISGEISITLNHWYAGDQYYKDTFEGHPEKYSKLKINIYDVTYGDNRRIARYGYTDPGFCYWNTIGVNTSPLYVTFNIANSAYELVRIEVDSSTVTTTENYAAVAMDDDRVVDLYVKLKPFKVTYIAPEQDADSTVPVDNTQYYWGQTVNVAKAPIPTRKGYVFGGWQANGNTHQPGGTFKMPASNVTLEALWYSDDIAIKYVPVPEAGGTVSRQSEYVSNITNPVGSTAAPNEKWKFVGWYDNADCTGNALSFEATYVPTKREAATYYAKFVRQFAEYRVEHYLENLNGQYDLDSDKTRTITGLVGYPVTGASYRLQYATHEYHHADPESTVIQADDSTVIKLYYNIPRYKVTYAYEGTVPEGAPTIPTEAEYPVGKNVQVEGDPELTGYTFEGWYTKSDNPVKVEAETAEFTMPVGNVELFGKFTRDTNDLTITKETEVVDNNGSVAIGDLENITVTISGPDDYTGKTKLRYSDLATGSVTLENVPTGEYTITEDTSTVGVPGYTLVTTGDNASVTTVKDVSVTKDGTGTAPLKNVYSRNMTTVEVSKTWDDAFNQDGKRPAEITLKIVGNVEGKDSVVLASGIANAAGGWKYTAQVPTHTPDGLPYTYSADEDERGLPSGYTKVTPITGLTVTNSYTPELVDDITVTKVWNDADNVAQERPADVTIVLLQNGNVYRSVVLGGTDTSKPLTHTFTNLPKNVEAASGVAESATPAEYTVVEGTLTDGTVTSGAPAGYSVNYNSTAANQYTITNTIEQKKVSISGTKHWIDTGAEDRPESITLKLMRRKAGSTEAWGDPVATKTIARSATSQTYTFDNLDQFNLTADTAYAYEYKVEEVTSNLSNYEAPTYADNVGQSGDQIVTFTTNQTATVDVTNRLAQVNLDIEVSKDWVDDEATHEDVTVKVYARAKGDTAWRTTAVKSATFATSHTFKNLPKYEYITNNGSITVNELEYKVEEDSVDDGYTTEYYNVADALISEDDALVFDSNKTTVKIINRINAGERVISVNKTWDLPAYVTDTTTVATFTLTQWLNGEQTTAEYDAITITSPNKTSATTWNVPVYNTVTGKKFEYKVEESVNNSDYVAVAPVTLTSDNNTAEFTNKLAERTLTVTKVAYPSNTNETFRFTLTRVDTGEPVTTYLDNGNKKTLDAGEFTLTNGDSESFTLPVGEYKVTENLNGWYSAAREQTVQLTVGNTDTQRLTFTNVKLIDTTVNKTWIDNNNSDDKRDTVTFNLYATIQKDNKTHYLNSSYEDVGTNKQVFDTKQLIDGAQVKFTDLRDYMIDGTDITYSVEEEAITGYKQENSGLTNNAITFTNTLMKDITVNKVWTNANGDVIKGAGDITAIISRSIANEDPVEYKKIVLTPEALSQTLTVEKYDENGNVYKYEVSEQGVVKNKLIIRDITYSVSYDNNMEESALTITNKKDDVPTKTAQIQAPVRINTTTGEITSGDSTASELFVPVGGLITYTISYTNYTYKPATVTVTDTLGAGLEVVVAGTTAGYVESGSDLTWTIENVPALTSGTVTVVAEVTSTAGNTVENEAEVSIDGVVEVTNKPVNNVVKPSMSVTKTAEDKPYSAGDEVTFTIVVTNTGNVELKDIVLTDDNDSFTVTPNDAPLKSLKIKENGTYVPYKSGEDTFSLKKGASQEFQATYTISVNDKVIYNKATASAPNPVDPKAEPITDFGEKTITMNDAPSIDVEKTAADPDKVYTVGDTITYTITVTNTGNVTLNNIVVTDSLSQNENKVIQTIASLTPGQSETIPYSYTVTQDNLGDGEQGAVTNKATATADGNIKDEDEVTVKTDALPKLTIDKEHKVAGEGNFTDGEVSVRAGDVIEYQITVKNAADIDTETVDVTYATAKNVVVTETLPTNAVINGTVTASVGTYDPSSNKWTVGDLEAGATATLTFSVKVNNDVNTGDTVENAVKAEVTPGSEIDDSSEMEDTVTAKVDTPKLTITKVVDKTVTYTGDTVKYTITVKNENTGSEPAVNVKVEDTLPEGLTLLSAATDKTNVTPTTSGNKVEVTIPSIAARDTVTITVTARVVKENGEIAKNTAVITKENGTTPDGDRDDESDPIIISNPTLKISKIVVPKGIELTNDEKTFTFTVKKGDAVVNTAGIVWKKNGTLQTTAFTGEFTLKGGENVEGEYVEIDLPALDANGDTITYTIEETATGAWTTTWTGNVTGRTATATLEANKDAVKDITATNTRTMLNGDGKLSVTKSWIDDGTDDQKSRRPDLTFNLYAKAKGKYLTRTFRTADANSEKPLINSEEMAGDAGTLTFQFTDLPKYTIEGDLITYEVEEAEKTNNGAVYTCDAGVQTSTGAELTFTNRVADGQVPIKKNWQLPNGGNYGTTPYVGGTKQSVADVKATLALMKGETEVACLDATSTNEMTVTFTVPKDGAEYTVVELSQTGANYEVSTQVLKVKWNGTAFEVKDAEGETLDTISNDLKRTTAGSGALTITKNIQWKDTADKANVTFDIGYSYKMPDGTDVSGVIKAVATYDANGNETLLYKPARWPSDAQGSGQIALSDIPYGTIVTITESPNVAWKPSMSSNVTEATVEGASIAGTVTADATDDEVVVTNTRVMLNPDKPESEQGKIKVIKNWSPENVAKPSSLEAQLLWNKVEKEKKPFAADWTVEFTDLPAYDLSGEPYEYAVREVKSDGTVYGNGDIITLEAKKAEESAYSLYSYVVTIDDSKESQKSGEFTITNTYKSPEPAEKIAGEDKETDNLNLGDTISYTIKRTSHLNQKATATIKDVLPKGLTYVNGSATVDGTPKEPNSKVVKDSGKTELVWNNIPVDELATVTVTYEAKVNVDAITAGAAELKNVVEVKFTDEPEDINFQRADETVYTPVLSIAKEIEGSTTVRTNDTVTYKVTVTNSGAADATNVKIVDKIPEGLSNVEINGKTAEMNADRLVDTIIPGVAAGDSETVTITAKVTALAGTIDKNLVTITEESGNPTGEDPKEPEDPDGPDNPFKAESDPLTVKNPRLKITKIATDDSGETNLEEKEFVFKLTNNKGYDLSGVAGLEDGGYFKIKSGESNSITFELPIDVKEGAETIYTIDEDEPAWNLKFTGTDDEVNADQQGKVTFDAAANDNTELVVTAENDRKLINEDPKDPYDKKQDDGKLKVTKEWLEANGNPLTAHIAKATVKVNLYRFSSAEPITEQPFKTIELKADDWTGIFETLPATDAYGNIYTYLVREVDDTGKEKVSDDEAMFETDTAGKLLFTVTIDETSMSTGYTITNQLKDREDEPETTKVADKIEAQIDDVITYTISDVNPYGSTTTATVSDTLPDGIVYMETVSAEIINKGGSTAVEKTPAEDGQTLTWVIPNVQPMDSVKVVFKAKVTEAAVQYDALTNTATVSRKDDKDTVFKADEGKVDVTPLVPDLEMIKSLDPDLKAVKADQTFTYKLEVKNHGAGRATGVEVTDTLPEQVVAKLDGEANLTLAKDGKSLTWYVGTVEAGQTASITFDVTVKSESELGDSTEVINGAKITKQPPKDPKDPDKPDEDKVVTPIFRIDVDKTARIIETGNFGGEDGKSDTASLGDIIEYKITIRNLGGIAAEDIVIEDLMFSKAIDKNVVVSELLEKSTVVMDVEKNRMILSKLEAGNKVEITYQYLVTEEDILAQSVKNVATVTAPDPDDPTDPYVKEDGTVTPTDPPAPSFELTKEIINSDGKPYGFEDEIMYRVTFTNTGNVSLTETVIDDVAGAGNELKSFDLETVAPGETVTIEYTYIVKDGDLRPTYKADGVTVEDHYVTNTATVNTKPANEPDKPMTGSASVTHKVEQWYTAIFVDTRTNEVVEFISVPYGGSIQLPDAPEHRGYNFLGWRSPILDNITFNQVIYAYYERDTETIFDARIPLAGGYISNVGDCFD